MALDSLNRITIDVSDPLKTQVAHAVQEDLRSRFVEITLVRNGEPLDIPVGAVGVVGLRRPNDTYVLYDTDEDGNAAVTFDGSIATCYLRQEALAMAGSMYTSVSIYSADRTTRLTAFHFMTDVDATAVPSNVIVEHDYINIFQTELDEINTLLGDLSATATTLPAGSDATASYSDGVFSFGIPKGETGGITEEELEEALATKAPIITDSANGHDLFLSDGAGGMSVLSFTVDIEPAQSGTGDPSPDNIRSISGWSGAVVKQKGQNLFDVSSLTWNAGIRNDDGSAGSSSSSHYTNAIPIPENTSITISGTLRTSTSTYRVYFLKADGTWISRTGSAQASPNVLDPPSGCGMIQLQVSTNSSVNMQDVQVETGMFAHPYEPYVERTYSIDWTDSAGTVYGGKLDAMTGALTVTHAKMHFDSSLNWSKSGSKTSQGFWRYFANASPSMKAGSNQDGLCDKLPIVSVSSATQGVVLGYNNNSSVNILSQEASVADFKTWLTGIGGLDIVYPLLTEESYTLTPAQILLFTGSNNMRCDAGKIYLTYPCDTRRFIERLTVPREDDMIANANIAINTYFMIGNNLFRSTAAITEGTTIAVGTNCVALSLADALNALR